MYLTTTLASVPPTTSNFPSLQTINLQRKPLPPIPVQYNIQRRDQQQYSSRVKQQSTMQYYPEPQQQSSINNNNNNNNNNSKNSSTIDISLLDQKPEPEFTA